MIKQDDVIIIGGGPSGLRVAARLAGRGLGVRLLERKSRIGQNVICTGIVGKDIFEDFGLDRGSIIREIRTVRLVSPFATSILYEHPRSFACVVDREAFDGHIAGAALAAGAEIELDRRVEDLAVDASGVTVTAADGDGGFVRRRSRMAVLATGVDCSLHAKAGLGRPRDFLKGAQAELPAEADEPTTIFVGRDVAPGAFAWSVPAAGGRVRVGLLTRKDPKACLRAFLRARDAGTGMDTEAVPIRTRAVAQGLLAPTVADRVLSVGEAAGQIKTTTGGGVSYGLLCADIAAEALLEAFARASFDAASLRSYEGRWHKAIRREILIGHYARRMYARLSDRRIEGLFRLAQTDGIIPIIRERAEFDRHSGLILALLHRLSFMPVFRRMNDHLGSGDLS